MNADSNSSFSSHHGFNIITLGDVHDLFFSHMKAKAYNMFPIKDSTKSGMYCYGEKSTC